MRSKVISVIVFIVVSLHAPKRAEAWGMLGHRIVGEIASKYLTAKARAEIKKILGDESVAMASNWADFIRSDTNFRYLNPWHYINFDRGLSYAQMKDYLKSDTAIDAYTKLNFLINQLKKKGLPKSEKLMYLRLLIHIAGDIHQPFHSARKGDSGGNDIKVSWFGQSSNMHRVWDDQLIDFQKLSYTEYVAAINYVTVAQRSTWEKQPLSKWLFDSYQISEQLHTELRQPDIKLGFEYNFKHLKTLNQQLLKGGIHLAALLNQIFA